MAKLVQNPTDNEVKIEINGKWYVVESQGSLIVESDEDAKNWQRTHQFLTLEDTISAVELSEPTETPVEEIPIEETPNEEEVIDEEPKVKKTKK